MLLVLASDVRRSPYIINAANFRENSLEATLIRTKIRVSIAAFRAHKTRVAFRHKICTGRD